MIHVKQLQPTNILIFGFSGSYPSESLYVEKNLPSEGPHKQKEERCERASKRQRQSVVQELLREFTDKENIPVFDLDLSVRFDIISRKAA